MAPRKMKRDPIEKRLSWSTAFLWVCFALAISVCEGLRSGSNGGYPCRVSSECSDVTNICVSGACQRPLVTRCYSAGQCVSGMTCWRGRCVNRIPDCSPLQTKTMGSPNYSPFCSELTYDLDRGGCVYVHERQPCSLNCGFDDSGRCQQGMCVGGKKLRDCSPSPSSSSRPSSSSSPSFVPPSASSSVTPAPSESEAVSESASPPLPSDPASASESETPSPLVDSTPASSSVSSSLPSTEASLAPSAEASSDPSSAISLTATASLSLSAEASTSPCSNVDLQSDANNCGGCGLQCSFPNAVPLCVQGVCSYSCEPNFYDLNNATFDGCEYPCIFSGQEFCNGLDDDCNGLFDDGVFQLSCGTGACRVSSSSCVNGAPVTTCTPGTPTPETCNGIDDDCDGFVDEEFGTVTCGVGACRTTVSSCTNGQYTPCVPGTPSQESCNGIDDDCDGVIDNGIATTCPVDCGFVAYVCNAGTLTVCAPACCGDSVLQPGEECDDGNTLDGDGCSSTCQITACPLGKGDCQANVPGSLVCDTNLFYDTSNCGACGSVCNGTGGSATCSNTACVITCSPGRANCDGKLSTGCEINLQNDRNNCGACGRRCLSGTCCSNGNCIVPTNAEAAGGVCLSTCGDGIVENSEGCDDGDTFNGNGCSATCTVEAGWSCTGYLPSVCQQI